MKISELANLPFSTRTYAPSDELALPTCNIGVEVEAENVNIDEDTYQELEDVNWRLTEDGSLRNSGVEFVFREPMFGEDIINSLDVLCKTGLKMNWQMSERTSIHIHVDVREMSQTHLFNFITYYLIFEKALYNFSSDKKRENNIFCLPFYVSDFDLYRLYSILDARNTRDLHRTLSNFSKYSGLNVASILERGSLEFRHLEGTLDFNRIIDWINLLLSMKKASIDDEIDINELPFRFSFNGMDALARDVFGDMAPHVINYERADRDILDGVRIAQDAIFGHKYNQWIRFHHINRDTGVSPRFRKVMENKLGELGMIDELKYNEKEARDQVFRAFGLGA